MDPDNSSNDPLLSSSTPTSESRDLQRQEILSSSHVKKQPNHHIKFRIGPTDCGSGGSEDLGVLQELLTSPLSPNVFAPFHLHPENAERRHVPPPIKLSSASSISSSGASLDCFPFYSKFASAESSQPDEVLIELFDLNLEDERNVQGCWEETARWIKYEEDVEGVEHQRWGLPHVSFLSFRALLQLRKCIGKGVVLLDIAVADFAELIDLIADAISADGNEFGAQNRRRIAHILSLRHNHVKSRRISRISTAASSLAHFWDRGVTDKQQHLVTPRRSTSAVPLTPNAACAMARRVAEGTTVESGTLRAHGRSFACSPPTITEDDEAIADSANNSIHRDRFSPTRASTPNVKLTFDSTSADTPKQIHFDLHREERQSAKRRSVNPNRHPSWTQRSVGDLRTNGNVDVVSKKIGNGIELVQVLVGELKWMRKPRFVMVRFVEGMPIPEMAESCHPVRIIFVVLGPSLSDGSYHELGRSLATLLSNPHFKTIAFGARDRSQLIEGLDSFLDGSLVIPPGEIASKKLISGDVLWKIHRKWKRDREMRKQKESQTESDKKHDREDQGNNMTVVEGGQSNNDGGRQDSHGQCKPSQRPNNGGKQRRKGKEKETVSSDKRGTRFPFFKGLRSDLKNRFPHYWSDFVDAANFQCFTSVVFMFFACFVPAISFGGLLGKYTDERIGTIETLFAQCICGVIWGLFSAQPLMIMSATGPVLIFEASLYNFCEALQLDFLTIRFYAGLFILLIATSITALDGSRLLVFVTRFTEDIFATLISAIFIAESLHFIWHTFKENPVEDYNYYEKIHVNCRRHTINHTVAGQIGIVPMPILPFDFERNANLTRNRTAEKDSAKRLMLTLTEVKDASMSVTEHHRFLCGEREEPNTALLTAIIVFSTFILAFLLKKLRESFYLGKHLRRALGDFGVLISITIIALIVHLCIPDPYLQRLDMPDHINFTNPEKRGHGLLVTPKLTLAEWHGVFVALVAALLVFILLFVETEITELLLSRKERGCRKGTGMHWDLVLMGACAFLCSVLGLPWMCAAAVQSLAHCSSLTVLKKTAPGARPEVSHVIEQRVTTIGVALFIGLIAFGGNYLRLPLASLFGVFLYLGVINLCGVQLIQRVILFFIPEKYFPVTPYTELMSIWRMHLYTWIQLICVFIVYTVKYFKKTALAFPFVLMLFIFFRQTILPKLFTDKELKAIDGGDDNSENEEWRDEDYYDKQHIPV